MVLMGMQMQETGNTSSLDIRSIKFKFGKLPWPAKSYHVKSCDHLKNDTSYCDLLAELKEHKLRNRRIATLQWSALYIFVFWNCFF